MNIHHVVEPWFPMCHCQIQSSESHPLLSDWQTSCEERWSKELLPCLTVLILLVSDRLDEGDLVWFHYSGVPFWPAVVGTHKSQHQDSDTFCITFGCSWSLHICLQLTFCWSLIKVCTCSFWTAAQKEVHEEEEAGTCLHVNHRKPSLWLRVRCDTLLKRVHASYLHSCG